MKIQINKRCKCGARIVFLNHIDMSDGQETFIYYCGVCGIEIELNKLLDTQRF